MLAAQGFGQREQPQASAARLRRTHDRLGLFQIDSVNVLTRAHYLPAFSRIGNYDPALLERDAWGPKRQRRMFEYWAHEASLLPLDLHPNLRWRMAKAERGEAGYVGLRRFATERRAEADAILDRIRIDGPLTAAAFEDGKSRSRRLPTRRAVASARWRRRRRRKRRGRSSRKPTARTSRSNRRPEIRARADCIRPRLFCQEKNRAAWPSPDRRRPRGERIIGTALPLVERPAFPAMITA